MSESFLFDRKIDKRSAQPTRTVPESLECRLNRIKAKQRVSDSPPPRYPPMIKAERVDQLRGERYSSRGWSAMLIRIVNANRAELRLYEKVFYCLYFYWDGVQWCVKFRRLAETLFDCVIPDGFVILGNYLQYRIKGFCCVNHIFTIVKNKEFFFWYFVLMNCFHE